MMRFALVNGVRQEAQTGLSGVCPGCNNLMVAKCGPVRIKHWAHKGDCTGDSWWEKETEWHLGWKSLFPNEWQEIRHVAEDGELHIADVKTDQEFVLEFQHSYLKPEERKSREDFYKKMIWIVDATKRKRDQAKFEKLLNGGTRVHPNLPLVKLVGYLDESALIRDWASSPVPVLFDFGDSTLWLLQPNSTVTKAHIVKFSKEYFIDLHRNGSLKKQELDFWFGEEIKTHIQRLENPPPPQIQRQRWQPPQRPMRRQFRF